MKTSELPQRFDPEKIIEVLTELNVGDRIVIIIHGEPIFELEREVGDFVIRYYYKGGRAATYDNAGRLLLQLQLIQDWAKHEKSNIRWYVKRTLEEEMRGSLTTEWTIKNLLYRNIGWIQRQSQRVSLDVALNRLFQNTNLPPVEFNMVDRPDQGISAGGVVEKDGQMVALVDLNRKLAHKFKQDPREYLEFVARTVAHELRHVEQYERSGPIPNEKAPDFSTNQGKLDYLSNPYELDAFARDIVSEILYDTSIDSYQGFVQFLRRDLEGAVESSRTLKRYYRYVKPVRPRVWKDLIKRVVSHARDIDELYTENPSSRSF